MTPRETPTSFRANSRPYRAWWRTRSKSSTTSSSCA
jgi:hypothetical protein